MMTAPDGKSGAVDSLGTARNRANAFAHLNRPSAIPQLESASAAKGAGQKLDRRTDFSYPDLLQVAHSCRPLMGMNEYPDLKILRGKWVLHARTLWKKRPSDWDRQPAESLLRGQ